MGVKDGKPEHCEFCGDIFLNLKLHQNYCQDKKIAVGGS